MPASRSLPTSPARLAVAAALALAAAAAHAGKPHYVIVDLGVVGSTATASQAVGVSPDGRIAVGRDLDTTSFPAVQWTRAGGAVALPNLAGRSFAQANGVNDAGVAVGTSTTTAFGSGALPVKWSGGNVAALPLPEGQSVGRAWGINAAGVAVGSVGSDFFERAAIYAPSGTRTITTTTDTGRTMVEAYGISDGGVVAGNGIDPDNAAVNVALVYDSVADTMTDIGALPGDNSALAFGLSADATYVVGSSMVFQGSGLPYVWSAAAGMVAIPLPPETSTGSGRAVNDRGWVVGNAGGLYSVPFLYAQGRTYALWQLVPKDSGWDFRTNTSASAEAITDAGTIVGTAVHEGETHAYAMFLRRN